MIISRNISELIRKYWELLQLIGGSSIFVGIQRREKSTWAARERERERERDAEKKKYNRAISLLGIRESSINTEE